MWKFVLLAVLALAHTCAAQTPTRPKIPETFQAEGQIEAHLADHTAFGRFFWASDVNAKVGVENSTYDEEEGLEVKRLVRLDMGKEYFDRNQGGRPSCTSRNITNFNEIWTWVNSAIYGGKVEFRHIEHDLWTYSAAGVDIELLVNTTHPDVPVILRRYIPLAAEFLHFIEFTTDQIRPSDFTIPPECQR